MSSNIKVRNIVIGSGIPKICVPIIGATNDEIIREAKKLIKLPVDIIEWRADFYNQVEDMSKVIDITLKLRNILTYIPMIFTFRTTKEGGVRALDGDLYSNLIKKVIETKAVDLIDVELFIGDEKVKDLIALSHLNGIKVIVSNHDFHKTPKKEELVLRLSRMQELGADISKIAVMPKNKLDVIELLLATILMQEKEESLPIITMSMNKDGIISRLVGEFVGSCITFGSGEKASAPGQVAVEDLDVILKLLHKVWM